MEELIEATLAVGTAIDMTNALLDGRVKSEQSRKLDDLIHYVQTSAMPGAGGQTRFNPTGSRFTAPANQTHRPSAPWGNDYPGGQFSFGSPFSSGSMSMARRSAGGIIHQVWGAGSGDTYEEHSKDPNTGETTYKRFDRNGNFTGLVEGSTVSRPDMRAARNRVGATQAANRVAGAGGGILDEVKKIPVVGTIVGLVQDVVGLFTGITDTITSFRKSNSGFQSIYAGSNIEGMTERMHQEAYVWANRLSGGFTPEDAKKVFQGVSQLGYRGGARQQREDFAYANYKRLGMSPEESLSFLQQSAKYATNDFDQLRSAINGVSQAARETSQNATVLRTALYQNRQSALSAGYGDASTQVAQAQTMVTAGVDRRFAGVKFNMSQGMEAIRAATAGYANPLAYDIANRKDGGRLEGKTEERLIVNALRNSSGQTVAWLQNYLKNNPAPKNYNEAYGLLMRMPSNALPSSYAIQTAFAVAGIDINTFNDPNIDPAVYAILYLCGTVNIDKATQKAQHRDIRVSADHGLGGFFGGGGGKGPAYGRSGNLTFTPPPNMAPTAPAATLNPRTTPHPINSIFHAERANDAPLLDLTEDAKKVFRVVNTPRDPKVEAGAINNAPVRAGGRVSR